MKTMVSHIYTFAQCVSLSENLMLTIKKIVKGKKTTKALLKCRSWQLLVNPKNFMIESLNLKMKAMAKVQIGVMIGGGLKKCHMLMLSKKML